MQLTVKQIIGLANKAYPKARSVGVPPQTAFVRGYLCAMKQQSLPSPTEDDEDFLLKVAKGLRELWPSGEKDGKYPWRDSITNLVKRLEFIWTERDLGDKYTVEDCLRAGRRYLAQFQNDKKYMQILKYFIFKQEKSGISTKDGKITYTYSSKLVDFLGDSAANEAQKMEESLNGTDFDIDTLSYGGELV